MPDRLVWFRRALVAALACLVLRLIGLQLWQGSRYRDLADRNRLRVVPEAAPRGQIVDRHSRLLATTRSVFFVAAIPQEFASESRWRWHESPHATAAASRAAVFAQLSRLVGKPAEELERRFRSQRTLPFVPATLVPEIPKLQALEVAEAHTELPGIVVDAAPVRDYPLGRAAAHVIGYVGQPTEEAFPVLKQYGVRPTDAVGRSGIEQEFEAYLRGRSGGSVIEVDHRARQVRVMGRREPAAGQTVVLTVDAKLCSLIADQFGGRPGAAVVMRPMTGEVVALVSVPDFDPGIFVRQDRRELQQVLTDPESPLLDRATMGQYMPGSIIKLLTAAVALQHRIITPATPLPCVGFVLIGGRRFHCWNRDGHGSVTLRDALTVSCNSYFLEVGRRVGLERLRAGFQHAGLGRRTNWVLGDEPGYLPPPGRWFSEGEAALLAIGQGEILLTPLQAAVAVSAIANGGWILQPWVVKRIGDHVVERSVGYSLEWPRDTLDVLREGMLAVVNGPKGTGIQAHSDQVRIAGKTGTAQTHIPGRPNGWFVGFCPADHPLVALAVVAEHGGSGGELPSFIAKTVCEYVAAHPDAVVDQPADAL